MIRNVGGNSKTKNKHLIFFADKYFFELGLKGGSNLEGLDPEVMCS